MKSFLRIFCKPVFAKKNLEENFVPQEKNLEWKLKQKIVELFHRLFYKLGRQQRYDDKDSPKTPNDIFSDVFINECALPILENIILFLNSDEGKSAPKQLV